MKTTLAVAFAVISTSNAYAAGSKLVAYSATMTFSSLLVRSGACNVGYSSNCNGQSCLCLKFSGASGSGKYLGAVTNATLNVTLDLDFQTLDNRCYAGFGDLSIEGTKESEDFDVTVSDCSFPDITGRLSGSFALRQPTLGFADAVGSFNYPLTGPDNFNPKTRLSLTGKANRN